MGCRLQTDPLINCIDNVPAIIVVPGSSNSSTLSNMHTCPSELNELKFHTAGFSTCAAEVVVGGITVLVRCTRDPFAPGIKVTVSVGPNPRPACIGSHMPLIIRSISSSIITDSVSIVGLVQLNDEARMMGTACKALVNVMQISKTIDGEIIFIFIRFLFYSL
jgi:hypothetical protein